MSGIVNLYVPAANFINTIYTPSEDGTQLTLAGTVNGQPINATSYIGNNNSQYYGQVKANFLSGSEASELVAEKEKGHKWTLRPPKAKGAKSPEKGPSLEEQLQRQVKHNPLKRPENTVVQLPKEKDPVGILSGTYDMTSLPWPSAWKVYLNINNQISGGPGLVYEYYIAADPNDMSDPWDACFSVTNFTSKGEAFTYPNATNYTLSPYVTAYFNFETPS
jgi:hypothetical protein